MTSLKPYLKGIVILSGDGCIWRDIFFGRPRPTSRPPTKTTKLEALKATALRKKSGLQ